MKNRVNVLNEGISDLESVEGTILMAINNYFALMWSRHYEKFNENTYAVRVLGLILHALREGFIPPKYNFCNYIHPSLFVQSKGISRLDIEGYFVVIADYLKSKTMKTDDVRSREYKGIMDGSIR